MDTSSLGIEYLLVTGLTAYPEKAMLKPAAFQILVKFAHSNSEEERYELGSQ